MKSAYFQDRFTFDRSNKTLEFQGSLEEEYYMLLAETQGVIGKLDGICQFVPNVDTYIKLMMIQEVCASCELENEPAKFYDFFDCGDTSGRINLSTKILNAIQYVQDYTFSENLLKTLSGILSNSKAVENEYRKSDGLSVYDIFQNSITQPVPQNWISTEVKDIGKYIANSLNENSLTTASTIHYQLEVLNPFSSYSRVIARIIAMMVLKWHGLLNCPILWLSNSLVETKIEYKDRIITVYKQGEDCLDILWGRFFLRAVNTSAKKAIQQIETLERERKKHLALLLQIGNGNKSILTIYDYVAKNVIVNIRQISDALGLSFSNVSKVVAIFENAGILRQVVQKERYRQFGYVPMLDLIEYD